MHAFPCWTSTAPRGHHCKVPEQCILSKKTTVLKLWDVIVGLALASVEEQLTTGTTLYMLLRQVLALIMHNLKQALWRDLHRQYRPTSLQQVVSYSQHWMQISLIIDAQITTLRVDYNNVSHVTVYHVMWLQVPYVRVCVRRIYVFIEQRTRVIQVQWL